MSHPNPNDEWRAHLLESRRQGNVSLSISEGEFVGGSLSQAAQEVVYLRERLKDFGYEHFAATEIYQDNLACIAMSGNPVRQKILLAHRYLSILHLRVGESWSC